MPKNAEETGIKVYDTQVTASDSVKSLDIRLDGRLSSKAQEGAVSANTRRSSRLLYPINRRKGATSATIHHIATTICLPAMP